MTRKDSKKLNFWCDPEQLDRWKAAAKLEDRSLSSFLRQAADDRADRVVRQFEKGRQQ